MTEIQILNDKIMQIEIERILLKFALREITLEEARAEIIKICKESK